MIIKMAPKERCRITVERSQDGSINVHVQGYVGDKERGGFGVPFDKKQIDDYSKTDPFKLIIEVPESK